MPFERHAENRTHGWSGQSCPAKNIVSKNIVSLVQRRVLSSFNVNYLAFRQQNGPVMDSKSFWCEGRHAAKTDPVKRASREKGR